MEQAGDGCHAKRMKPPVPPPWLSAGTILPPPPPPATNRDAVCETFSNLCKLDPTFAQKFEKAFHAIRSGRTMIGSAPPAVPSLPQQAQPSCTALPRPQAPRGAENGELFGVQQNLARLNYLNKFTEQYLSKCGQSPMLPWLKQNGLGFAQKLNTNHHHHHHHRNLGKQTTAVAVAAAASVTRHSSGDHEKEIEICQQSSPQSQSGTSSHSPIPAEDDTCQSPKRSGSVEAKSPPFSVRSLFEAPNRSNSPTVAPTPPDVVKPPHDVLLGQFELAKLIHRQASFQQNSELST